MKIVLLCFFISSSVLSKEYFIKFTVEKSNSINKLESFLSQREFGNRVKNIRRVDSFSKSYAVVKGDFSSRDIDTIKSNSDLVSIIEPNELNLELFSDSTLDPYFSKQWGLQSKNGINIEAAWEITKGDEDLVIAVVDTGVDYNHEDLQNNMWINSAEKNGLDGVDDDNNGYVDDIYGVNTIQNNGNPMDDIGHGTHCAGVIGASHNSIGVAGVMGEVKLMAIKIFSRRGGSSVEAIVRAIDYAIANDVKVMSNSWGGPYESLAVSDAINLAKENGILFVAASGNGNWWGKGYDIDKKPIYPASYTHENIITVGAVKSSGKKSFYSNYGEKSVDVFAPGTRILSTIPNNKYNSQTGTSMATPAVAGVIGLMYAQDPNADWMDIKNKLIESASENNKFKAKSTSNGGVIDAFKALQ